MKAQPYAPSGPFGPQLWANSPAIQGLLGMQEEVCSSIQKSHWENSMVGREWSVWRTVQWLSYSLFPPSWPQAACVSLM